MTENTMPATEAMYVASEDFTSYELAFHVLPTVAEGEVASVMIALKAAIVAAGGVVFDEEAAERVELAYEVTKSIEGHNRKFKSAYFGWVRFKIDAANIPALIEIIEDSAQILRHLLVKLTYEEEQNPFRFHEAMAAANIKVINYDVDVAEEVTEIEAEVVDDVLTDAIVVPEVVDTKAEVA